MTSDDYITETVKCPECGHDAKFTHPEDNTFGWFYCRHCEEEAERMQEEICREEWEAENA